MELWTPIARAGWSGVLKAGDTVAAAAHYWSHRMPLTPWVICGIDGREDNAVEPAVLFYPQEFLDFSGILCSLHSLEEGQVLSSRSEFILLLKAAKALGPPELISPQ